MSIINNYIIFDNEEILVSMECPDSTFCHNNFIDFVVITCVYIITTFFIH